MGCDTNYGSCTDVVTSDCVKWIGPDIACLGITSGQSISQTEVLIANEVCTILSDIDISSTTITGELIALLGNRSKTIASLFQILLDYDVTLRGLIQSVQDQVTISNQHTIDFKCIAPVVGPCDTPPSYDLNNIIQLIINYVCALNVKVDGNTTTIPDTATSYAGYLLKSAINTCQPNRIAKYGDGPTTGIQFRGFVPPYTAMAYFGPLSNFDASGRGVDGTPMCGFYICNGNNGTPDLRGRTIIGATNGVGGGSLNAQVDPTQNAGLGSYTQWDFGGEIRHKLNIGEIPSHKHNPWADDHNHTVTDTYANPTDGGPIGGGWANNHTKSYVYLTQTTSTASVNVHDNNTGGDGYHENRMPYTVGVWIMMIN